MAVIVWTHRNDYRLWTPYPPEISNGIEKIYAANEAAFLNRSSSLGRIQFGPFNPDWTGFSLDVSIMKQCQADSGRRFDVDRVILDDREALAKGFVWEFEDDTPSHWSSYDVTTMQYLEEADTKMKKRRSKSRKKQPLIDMSQFFLPYVLDVEKLQQTRLDTGKVRNIQRRPLTQPYVQDTSGRLSQSTLFYKSHTVQPSVASGTGQQSVVTHSSFNTGKSKTTATTPQQSSATPAPVQQPTVGASAATATQQSSAKLKVKKSSTRKQRGVSPPVRGAEAAQPDEDRETLPSENNIRILTKKCKAKKAEAVLKQYVIVVNEKGEEEDESDEDMDTDEGKREQSENHDCCICYDKLTNPSGYGDGKADAHAVVQLKQCYHKFHRLCLLEMFKATHGHKNECLQCPSCKLIYGEKTGNCPAGVMTWAVLVGSSVAGYEGYDTISVSYDIKPGVQGPEHPKPGQAFYTQGFPRIGFLPDTNEGRKVLKLLIEAWRRRLMFTVGTSYTTGSSDVVTWNEIHHKTELYGNYSGHGYPDPAYLANVVLELADHGVTEDCLS